MLLLPSASKKHTRLDIRCKNACFYVDGILSSERTECSGGGGVVCGYVWSQHTVDWASTGVVVNPARGQVNREINYFFLCSRLRLKIRSRETGSTVPTHTSPFIFHTQAESGAYSGAPITGPAFRDAVYLYRKPPSDQYRVYRVTQLRTDGFHRQVSAGAKSS